MIGEQLGSYRIVAELGAGGMGTVYLAEHTMLGSRAAIKVLRAELSQQPQVVQRFFDEARAATRIADPGIITVLDFGTFRDGSAYLVMEHLAGETLTQRIRRQGCLPPSQALAIARQCAMAMAAAHARSIVHRDLKPDNIFLVPDPALGLERVKVLDFGIAKLLGDASHDGTQTGMILGTPGYMSPEQCRGAGNVDARTDVYALGCVLYHMLCRRPPFDAPTPGDMIAAHIMQTALAPSMLRPGISPALDELVLRCLAKSVGDRVQTMRELVAAIDGLATIVETPPPQVVAPGIHAGPTVATGAHAAPPMPTTLQDGIGESFAPDARRSRGGLVAIALVAAISIVIVVAIVRRDDRAPTRGAVPAAPDAPATRADQPPPPAEQGPALPGRAATPKALPSTTDAAPLGTVVATPPDAGPKLARPSRGSKPGTLRRPRPVGTTGAATGAAAGSGAIPGGGSGSSPGKGSASSGAGSDSAYGHR